MHWFVRSVPNLCEQAPSMAQSRLMASSRPLPYKRAPVASLVPSLGSQSNLAMHYVCQRKFVIASQRRKQRDTFEHRRALIVQAEYLRQTATRGADDVDRRLRLDKKS
jgi:hypothetical protein